MIPVKKLVAGLLAVLLLSWSTVCMAERDIFEYLVLYQRSKDALKYEYEGFEDFEVAFSPLYLQSPIPTCIYDHALLTLDSDMHIKDGLFSYFDVNGNEEENMELIFSFVAAFCALEYGVIEYSIYEINYQSGLTDNETVFDEALSVYNDSFNMDYDAFISAMDGESVLLYKSGHYTYYLEYSSFGEDEMRSNDSSECFYIHAVANL